VSALSPVPKSDPDPLLTPAEVALIFRVDPKTVTRWAAADPPRIRSTRTPGGHRRFRSSEVQRVLSQYEQGIPELSRNPV
jgi:excisionase family DNA binding protein